MGACEALYGTYVTMIKMSSVVDYYHVPLHTMVEDGLELRSDGRILKRDSPCSVRIEPE